MLFNSIPFLIFFPIVVAVYFIIPFKLKWLWLLIASYYFYMSWNPLYALLMLTSTFITYLSGILISATHRIKDAKKQKTYANLWVALSFITNLSILFFFKYFNFFITNLNIVLGALKIELLTPSFDVLLPVGISFYTFQALGYTMDVYRNDIRAEKHFGKYALFVSFFPQLVAGPIERSGALLTQIYEEHKFSYEAARDGLLLMLFGYFQKVVIADWLAVFVDNVFKNVYDQSGLMLVIAILFFTVQIYCDFAGYSNIAIGAAKVMGFRLMQNFKQPYFAVSIRDFWHRWHISLSTWFRDYLYIPLGGGKVSRIRKYLNVMITFLVSGLWHGASWSFVIWGGLHGFYQVTGEMLSPAKNKIFAKMKINTSSAFFSFIKRVTVFFIVSFTWIFFRAGSAMKSLYVIGKIFTSFSFEGFSLAAINKLGLSNIITFMLLFSILALFVIDYLRERKFAVTEILSRQKWYFRWAFYYLAVAFILIFGAFGLSGTLSQFIYFQF